MFAAAAIAAAIRQQKQLPHLFQQISISAILLQSQSIAQKPEILKQMNKGNQRKRRTI